MAFPIRVVVAFATVTFVATAAQGQTTWFVDDDNCPGPGTGTQADPFCIIQDGIDAAVDGDEVVVAPGTYVEAVNFLGKAIMLRSIVPTDEDIVGATVIDGAAAGSVVIFQSDEGAESILDGLTITNGAGEHGAGIYCFSSSPTIRNCMITNNTLNPGFNSGGGIYCTRDSSPAISDCTITGNVASRHGGGIYCSWNSSPTISGSTISQNRATLGGVGGHGGGIHSIFENSNPVITDCIIVDNEALHRGGGIYCGEGSNAVIADSLIARNFTNTATSGAGGGGIYCHAATITRCTIIDNFGSFSGGGIISHGDTTISNCIISNNTTVFGGGGIEFWGAPSIMSNCVIASNSGSLGGGIAFQSNSSVVSNCTITRNNGQDGGGVHVRNDSQPLIHNSIIWGNTAPFGHELYLGGVEIVLTVHHSDIQGGQADVFNFQNVATLDWGAGNIDANPEFVNATQGDLHLKINSPCIDAGDNVVVDVSTDLDGNPRIVDGDGDSIAVVDMGAYEFQGCGNGVIDAGEECDDGDDNSDTEADACRTDCRQAWCGDGVVDTGEECDDGNGQPGDGCDATCHIEPEVIPTVSGWGMVVLTLLLLSAGKTVLNRRHHAAA